MFKDRSEAGKRLVSTILNYDRTNAMVVAIPRGGVIVAAEIANSLKIPLRLIYVKKIGHPNNPEFSIGAMAQRNHKIDLHSDFSPNELVSQIHSARIKMQKQYRTYGHAYEQVDLKNKVIFLVDDGAATGNSILLSVKELRAIPVQKIIVMLPVCPRDTFLKIQAVVDELICLEVPENFNAVGQFYENFIQVGDNEVIGILKNL